jgi:hypothetical protein
MLRRASREASRARLPPGGALRRELTAADGEGEGRPSSRGASSMVTDMPGQSVGAVGVPSVEPCRGIHRNLTVCVVQVRIKGVKKQEEYICDVGAEHMARWLRRRSPSAGDERPATRLSSVLTPPTFCQPMSGAARVAQRCCSFIRIQWLQGPLEGRQRHQSVRSVWAAQAGAQGGAHVCTAFALAPAPKGPKHGQHASSRKAATVSVPFINSQLCDDCLAQARSVMARRTVGSWSPATALRPLHHLVCACACGVGVEGRGRALPCQTRWCFLLALAGRRLAARHALRHALRLALPLPAARAHQQAGAARAPPAQGQAACRCVNPLQTFGARDTREILGLAFRACPERPLLLATRAIAACTWGNQIVSCLRLQPPGMTATCGMSWGFRR